MKERNQRGTSSSILGGWVETADGFMTTAKKPQSFTTEEYKLFSESQRARWDLGEFLKVKLQQLRRRQSRNEG